DTAPGIWLKAYSACSLTSRITTSSSFILSATSSNVACSLYVNGFSCFLESDFEDNVLKRHLLQPFLNIVHLYFRPMQQYLLVNLDLSLGLRELYRPLHFPFPSLF